MATDATGAPTSLGIPKYNTSADAPSGLGFNAAMDAIDALIVGKVAKPVSISTGEVPVWNGSSFVRSSVTNVGPTSLGSGTPDVTKFLRGDGAWATPTAQPRARATKSVAQAIANNTNTAVTFDTEAFDTDTIHDLAVNNSRLTAKTAGIYLVKGTIIFAASAAGSIRGASIGAASILNWYEVVKMFPAGGSLPTAVQVVGIVPMAVNDYVELYAYQDSGGALNVQSSDGGFSTPTSFEMVRIGS